MNSAVDVNKNAVQTTSFDMSSAQDVNPPPPKKEPSGIDTFLRGIMKYSPGEEMETSSAKFDLYAGIEEGDSPEVKQKKYTDAMNREPQEAQQEAFNEYSGYLKTGKLEETPQAQAQDKKMSDFEKQRDKDIASQGILRQFRDPLTAGVAVGAVTNPIATAVGVGAYTIKDHFFDGRRWIEKEHPDAPPLVKDGVEMLDFMATVATLGVGGTYAKKFYMDRSANLNLPKAMAIEPEQVKNAQGTSTLEKLGVTDEHAKASLNSNLPIQIPSEKVVDLATSGDWDKAKQDLGITPPPPEPPPQLGLSETTAPIDSNKYVSDPKLNFSLKENMKNTADEIRKQVTGQLDKQIVKVNQWAESGKKSVPDETEQQGMFWYAGAGGDKAKIVDFMMKMEDLKPGDVKEDKYEKIKSYYDEIKPQLQAALDLSPEAIEKVKQGSQYYAEAGQVAKKLDTIKTIRENYQSNRIYKPEPPEDFIATGKRRSTISTGHAKARFYETPFDAVLGGKQFATTNYFDALTVHNEELAYVNTTRAMLDQMEKMDLGEWAESKKAPEGYAQVGDLQKGTKIFIAPEGIAKGLEAISDPNMINKIKELSAVGKLNGFVKSFNVAFSFFHHKQFVEQVLSSKNGEKILADFAMKVGTGKDPFDTPEFQKMEQDLAEDGLRTSMRQDNFDIMADLRKVKGNWLDKIEKLPGVKQAIELTDKNTEFLFNKMQRYFKVMTAGQRVADWMGKNPNASEEQAIQARREICRAINNTFGGLNWEMLGINKNTQALLRFYLFAPDWLMSAVLNTKDAVFDWNTQAGRVSRATVVKGLLVGTTVTQISNKLTTGHFTWDNKKGHKYEYEISPDVYVNFYGGATGELVKAWSNVVETGGLKGALRYVSNKLSPAIRGEVMLASQRNYAGEDIFKGDNALEKNMNGILNIASSIAPLPFASQSSSMGYLMDKDNPIRGKVVVGLGLARYSIGENKWDKNGGKVMKQFYQKVGEEKFEEANAEYLKRLDKWEHEVETKKQYKDLSDDYKKAVITREKKKIKDKVMEEFGFHYQKTQSKKFYGLEEI